MNQTSPWIWAWILTITCCVASILAEMNQVSYYSMLFIMGIIASLIRGLIWWTHDEPSTEHTQ